MINKTTSNQTTVHRVNRFAGQQFLLAFFSLLKSAKIHRDNNDILLKNLLSFRVAVKNLFRGKDKIEFIILEGSFYLHGEMLHYQQNLTSHIKSIIIFFEEHWLDGLCFHPNIMSASDKDILSFVRYIHASIMHENPNEWLGDKLNSPAHQWVEIIDASQTDSITTFIGDEIRRADSLTNGQKPANPGNDSKPEDGSPQQSNNDRTEAEAGKRAKAIYGNAMHALRQISKAFSTRRQTGIGQSVRLIQGMVNMIINDDFVLLGLSTIRDYDDYTFVHSVNVAILSIHLGYRIGLSRSSLEQLGLGALFHDLGKIDVSIDILNKPGRLNRREFAELKKHSINSVNRIILLRTTYDKKASIITAPFEHHLRYNLTGYPQSPRKRPLSLFGRIVAIADTYDAVTSPRIYRQYSLSPDRALGLMFSGAGREYDPILLKVFINMLGVYPVGTILELASGQLGIVTGHVSRDEEAEKRLRIMLLLPTENSGFRRGDMLDLGAFNKETGGYSNKVVKSHHPSKFGIQPAKFFHQMI